jgi:hypothetical protein
VFDPEAAMKSLGLLVLVWLVFQIGALIVEERRGGHAPVVKTSVTSVEAKLRDWPSDSREVAKDVMRRLGPPDVVEQDLMRWNVHDGIALILFRQGHTRVQDRLDARADAGS